MLMAAHAGKQWIYKLAHMYTNTHSLAADIATEGAAMEMLFKHTLTQLNGHINTHSRTNTEIKKK